MATQLKPVEQVPTGVAVYAAIAAVQGELAKIGIAKKRQNKQGDGYMFRGIDDVYAALSPLLAANGLCVIPRVIERVCEERKSSRGNPLFYVTVHAEFDFVSAIDGSKHTAATYGEAMDSGDKATNKAMSAAYKYAAFMTFAIPTEGDNDADATTHEVAIEPSVSDEQYEDLLATATDVGANLQIFCKLYNIDSLRDIKASNFESAKKALLAKKRKAA